MERRTKHNRTRRTNGPAVMLSQNPRTLDEIPTKTDTTIINVNKNAK
jgi:hypothetical protein